MVKKSANSVVWSKPIIHEALAILYLRLNGYLTTGFIAHSGRSGETLGEIDCLAIRHPYHSQPQREIESSKFLNLRPKEVDVIICEVKSSIAGLRFNESLHEALPIVLSWAGLFTEEQVCRVVKDLLLQMKCNDPAVQMCNGVVEHGCRVRLLLCCPPCKEDEEINRWCLRGPEMLHYIATCLKPQEPRQQCSTRYDFGQWTYALSPLVTYFKCLQKSDSPSLEGLYRHILGG